LRQIQKHGEEDVKPFSTQMTRVLKEVTTLKTYFGKIPLSYNLILKKAVEAKEDKESRFR
jgi:hypothetical protein